MSSIKSKIIAAVVAIVAIAAILFFYGLYCGALTMLVNANGTPKLYKGE